MAVSLQDGREQSHLMGFTASPGTVPLNRAEVMVCDFHSYVIKDAVALLWSLGKSWPPHCENSPSSPLERPPTNSQPCECVLHLRRDLSPSQAFR